MLKKTIKYTDWNGIDREENFYFHISKSELAEFNMRLPGGLENYLEDIRNSMDAQKIMDLFKTLIKMAYGEKSSDGKYFRKSEQRTEDFMATPAFDSLFFELMTNEESAQKFIQSVVATA